MFLSALREVFVLLSLEKKSYNEKSVTFF